MGKYQNIMKSHKETKADLMSYKVSQKLFSLTKTKGDKYTRKSTIHLTRAVLDE